jgi:ABC-2 type transport system permease protein
MDKIFTIAVREFLETVKTKMFFVTSVLLPLLMLGLIFGSQGIAEIAEKEAQPTKVFAVQDRGGAVYDVFSRQIDEYNAEYPHRPYELERVADLDVTSAQLAERVNRGELYAYVVIPEDVLTPGAPSEEHPSAVSSPLTSGGGAPAESPIFKLPPGAKSCEFGRKDNNPEIPARINGLLCEAIVRVRFARAEPPVDLERVRRLEQPVGLRQVNVQTGEAAGDDMIRFMAPFAYMFLLFMGTLNISQGLLTSLLEEKGSRVIEVLLSAVSPFQLMAGKILGTVCVGALLMCVWGFVGYRTAQVGNMGYLVTTAHLTYVALYFVPGFLLMATFLAAAGAACNTLKEAQSMAAPLTILSIVPMLLGWLIMLNPNSILSIVLSYIPPITPLVMILRVCADPEIPMIQIVTTLALLWGSVFFMIWVSAKIFRVGVLMYGKPPSLRELARWLRYA